MERLILVKQSPAIQLGHMYEHIFCMHVDELFHSHHLYPRVDFALYGKMYHGGVLVVDVELYTPAAKRLAGTIRALDITFDEDILKRALSQLLAEHEGPMGSEGYEAIVQALKKLHTQPWQTLDEVVLIDAKKIRRPAGPIYLTDGKQLPARKLKASVLLDTNFARTHRDLIPLFRQIAGVVVATWQGKVANEFGYFSYDDMFRDTAKVTAATNIFHVPRVPDIEVNVTKIMDVCQAVVKDLRRHEVFDRYMSELSKVSYAASPDLAPNYEANYEDTLFFVGAKGWQQLATKQNCDLLIKHMQIEVVFGRDKVSADIN